MKETLYRKYRPQTFEEVIGQDQVKAVLEGALQKDAVAHAYLFAGTRGTGKTTIARIFGKKLGVEGSDLYEIDAASNRGIDDIRELREGVATLPFSSPYKLYIIDEAHMLTKEAWNALLKTLEEPPPHVIFILATTEIEKVPDTILSRCQTLRFETPSRPMLSAMVKEVAKKEKVKITPDAADLIARSAEGSYRDAHGILQKVLTATSDTTVEADEVAKIVGAPARALVIAIVEAIAEGDAAKALMGVSNAAHADIKIPLLIEMVLERMRAIMLLRMAPDLKSRLAQIHGEEEIALLEKLSKIEPPRVTAHALDCMLKAAIDGKRSALPEVALEIGIVSALHSA